MAWFKIPLKKNIEDGAKSFLIMRRIFQIRIDNFYHFKEVAIYNAADLNANDQSFYFFVSDESVGEFKSLLSDFGAVLCERPSPDLLRFISGDEDVLNKS